MSDSHAVVARHRAFLATFATQDLDGMAEFLTEDHVGMPPGRPQMKGRDEAREFWRQGFSMANSAFSTRDQHVIVTGDYAVDQFNWDMTITPNDGSTAVKDAGKCIWVWRRDGDNVWRLASAIWNSDLTEPTPWTGA